MKQGYSRSFLNQLLQELHQELHSAMLLVPSLRHTQPAGSCPGSSTNLYRADNASAVCFVWGSASTKGRRADLCRVHFMEEVIKGQA